MTEKKARNTTGKGYYQPKWKPENLPTDTVRIPGNFKELLLRIARALDDGTITLDQLTLWLDNQASNKKLAQEFDRLNRVDDSEIVRRIGRSRKTKNN